MNVGQNEYIGFYVSNGEVVLRKARRLPFEKRDVVEEVEKQHKEYPISSEVIFRFVSEIQPFVDSVLYDPGTALEKGEF